MDTQFSVDRVKRRRRRSGSKRRRSNVVKITRGPMKGHCRNTMTGHLAKCPSSTTHRRRRRR